MAKQQPTKTKPKLKPVNKPAKRKRTPLAWSDRKSNSKIGRFYMLGALFTLLTTTVTWALLGAKLQQSNADQLVNSYLFEHISTFSNATFPSAHSFFLKWPLFLLVRLSGLTSASFLVMTVAVTLLTVSSLAYIVYKIDKRPFVFGSLILALSSILLMIPPVPYPGALLPINMAMLATRNLEYILYIGCLILLIRAKKFASRGFWAGALLLGLLVASDKLFLYISLGGAVAVLVSYLIAKRKPSAKLAISWLILTFLAAIFAALVVWLVNTSGLTHLSSQASGGPFSLVHSLRLVVIGSFFAVTGLLTNFGANPAYNSGVVSQIPSTAWRRLVSLQGYSYLVNFLLFGLGIYAAVRILLVSFKPQKRKIIHTDTPTKLSILLIFSTFAALGAFIFTDHSYPVDARYISISLFALTIAAATFLRSKQVFKTKKNFIVVASVLVASVFVGVITTIHTYNDDKNALDNINERNSLIATALRYHPVDYLVGDYWRVVPIKQTSSQTLQVLPLSDCTHPQDFLSSKSWQPDLEKHSFAYVLSLDKNLTNRPVCSLDQVVKAFGKPNASLVIEGTPIHHKELLLYYDSGKQNKLAHINHQPQSTVGPIKIWQLPFRGCPKQTFVNAVAHQDDDLLFMNPDIINTLKNGDCVRTIYLTAGDAGSDKLYWLRREQGAMSAYDYMDGPAKDIWAQRTVSLSPSAYVTVATPRNNHNVSLIFFHLPDGNIKGHGFEATRYESLARLASGGTKTITSVDGQSVYNADQLISALGEMIKAFDPAEVHTQATYDLEEHYTDHSDHKAVGWFAQQAYQKTISPTVPIKFYYGYATRTMSQNVFDDELKTKTEAFLSYVTYANDTDCATMESCMKLPTYGAYLKHQYSYSTPN